MSKDNHHLLRLIEFQIGAFISLCLVPDASIMPVDALRLAWKRAPVQHVSMSPGR